MKDFPFNFHPDAALPGDGEQLIRSCVNARITYGDHPGLRNYMTRLALDELLDNCDQETRNARDVRFYMLLAHVNTQDPAGIRRLCNYWWDWGRVPRNAPRIANVSKFNPGEHYHVLGEKFGTLDEAKAHLRRNRYEFGRLIEEFFYPRQGD